jgi:phytoene dehydrogenase-like protein
MGWQAGTQPDMIDAVVIGAGPNGLVAANLLADAGWDVTVLEAQDAPGGGVSSAEYFGPGWISDVCSAFFPLAAASPVMRSLELERYGLRWSHAPAVLAHLHRDGAAILWRDPVRTADTLDRGSPGDGAAWLRLHSVWQRTAAPLLDSLLTPFPPVRAGVRLARTVGSGGLVRLARLFMVPVRRLAEEEFSGAAPGLLLAGCALHADLFPESTASALFGWLLTMLGHHAGYPVPQGGAGQLTAALVRRLESRGGEVRCGRRVGAVEVHNGRVAAVVTIDGERIGVRHAVLADVPATSLYGGLVAWNHLPPQLAGDVRRFQWDWATVKFDWAVERPLPWLSHDVAGAGTVHVADSIDELTRVCADLSTRLVPARPFVLLGQLSTADPSRSPAGTESVYGYTHVPTRVEGDAGDGSVRGVWDPADLDALAERVEGRIERHAPGFRSLIRARHVLGPAGLEEHDGNLVGGAINGGTSAIHQQLMFRPVPGLGRPETPVVGLYLASSSAHPGGGVHGACGANAARAALSARRPWQRLVVTPALHALLQGSVPRPLLPN